MAVLENLSDDEIRSKLAEYGHPVGPITETTRKILIKKLKQLVKEKKPVRKSVFSFSSAEESDSEKHGGVRPRKRTSMPPPSRPTYSSLRKSLPSRNNSPGTTTNTTFAVPSTLRAPSRRRDSSLNRSRRSTYDFDSGSDSDFNISDAPSSSRILSNHRASPTSPPLFSNTASNSRKESKPFFSNFTRRLARWGNDLNPQDIKETDVDDGPACNAAPSFAYRGASFARTLYNRPPSLEKRWSASLVEKGPMLLLTLFLLFFVWLSATYCLRVYQQRPLLSGKSDNVFPSCSAGQTTGCISAEELTFVTKLYKHVHQVLQSRAVQSMCGPLDEDGLSVTPYLTKSEIIQLLIKELPSEVGHIESGYRNLGLFIFANPQKGIAILPAENSHIATATCNIKEPSKAVPSDLEKDADLIFLIPCPELGWGCHLKLIFASVVYYCILTLVVGGLVYGSLRLFNYYQHTKEEEEKQVMDFVERILNAVTDICTRNQQEFVSIRHVHDNLIPPAQRPGMAAIWEKAVLFIEKNESRIRREIQSVWGEDTQVWRPLTPVAPIVANNPPPPENHLYPDLSGAVQKESQRVWQGEAFETSDGSINALHVSPTPCLKIRHMFKENKDYGGDWEVAVRDAIIEKCEGVGILHLKVDSHSKEGCVFVKCMSSAEAGDAFRRLHGSWFDGALVTVRYLRLERYHERFPDSVDCKVPLKPSNNLRLSMGRTGTA